MKKLLSPVLVLGGVAVLALSVDWSPVPARLQSTIEQVDQTYRGAAQVYNQTTGFLSNVSKAWGFMTEKGSEIFRLDFHSPLKTGQSWSGYTILGCEPTTPRIPCTIRYPEPIYWTAPRDGYLTVEGEYATFSSEEIPGYRFLFKGIDPAGTGRVARGDRLITAQSGEVQFWLQQGTENGWEFVPPSREAFYGLILGGRQ